LWKKEAGIKIRLDIDRGKMGGVGKDKRGKEGKKKGSAHPNTLKYFGTHLSHLSHSVSQDASP
jgi:hypothetical protein